MPVKIFCRYFLLDLKEIAQGNTQNVRLGAIFSLHQPIWNHGINISK